MWNLLCASHSVHLRPTWHFWHDVAAGESEVVALVRLCEAVVNIWEKQSKRERMYFWLMISEVSTHYWLVSLLPGLWKQRKSWWKRRYWLHYNQEARGKRGRRSGTSIVQILWFVSCDLLTLTKLNPHHFPKRLSGYKQIGGVTHWWDHSSHDPISYLWLSPSAMIQLFNTWTFYPPPNSFSLQNKRKEGNEGYMVLYREGQSKACRDKNEFIRKLEYERI